MELNEFLEGYYESLSPAGQNVFQNIYITLGNIIESTGVEHLQLLVLILILITLWLPYILGIRT
jgi:hypothetical protein|tara:strand:+ start:443 stop:634 length:192 start_codon:yes stop_codon:yes gene_type:complete